MKRIKKYQLLNGTEPYQEWLDGLDVTSQAKVLAYVTRLACGGSQRNIKPVGQGVFELKIDYGGGLRVYFGEVQNVIILLLLGGDKSTQKRDIQKAILYWRSYAKN